MYFLKLQLKVFCKHQKVVYGRPSVKWTSGKGNDMLYYYVIFTKSRLDIQFVKKFYFEMVIGQQIKEEGL